MLPPLTTLRDAEAQIAVHTRRTPLIDAPGLATAVGAASVHVKAESLQLAGSFKVRGAIWRLHQLSEAERQNGVIAYSSGNFAQGLALAGSRMGVAVTIVMPEDAPAQKRSATEGFGARVVLSHHGERPREEAASSLASEMAARDGLTLLHPFDDIDIVVGQASAGLEAADQMAERAVTPDLVLVCCRGGGLSAGVALAFHHLVPTAKVVAVEPEGFHGMALSLASGTRARTATGATICDALQATSPGVTPLAIGAEVGLTGFAVADAAVREAVARAFTDLKLVLEPSGAAGLAALFSGAADVTGRHVLVFATGGNVAADQFAALIAA